MGWYKEYPRDKNERVLRKGDFVMVEYIWNDGSVHQKCIGIIHDYEQRHWYGPWVLKVVFYDGTNFEAFSHDVSPERCEWVTKRRRILEQKLMLLKLESL